MLFVQKTESKIYSPSRNEVQITGGAPNKKESYQVLDSIVFVVDDEAVTWRPGC
jgi:hypothetical protein